MGKKLRMKTNKQTKMIFCILLFVSPLFIKAQQDHHLSQYDALPISLNPATTGMFQGSLRGGIQYRNQWRSLTKNSFITQGASFEMRRKKFGYGGRITNNKAGAGRLSALELILSGAYEITTDAAELHHLCTGVQIGFINKSVNISNLTFDNQYSTANGGGFDPNISSQENFIETSYFIPDLNFGVYYYNTNMDWRIRPYMGISGFHLTTPSESFLGATNSSLPMRWVMHGGAKVKINKTIELEPMFLVMQQAKINELNAGLKGYYYHSQSNSSFILGAFYRNKDAVILHMGVLYKEYTLGMSYDINTSRLSSFSNGRGGFEIAITYTMKNAQYVPSIQ